MKPTTPQEKRIYKANCITSHETELSEIQKFAPNIEDFFYSEHLGSWILKFKEGDDDEFETKDEMIQWIKADSSQL